MLFECFECFVCGKQASDYATPSRFYLEMMFANRAWSIVIVEQANDKLTLRIVCRECQDLLTSDAPDSVRET